MYLLRSLTKLIIHKTIKLRRFCYKYKIFTYAGLLFLTIQNFQLRQMNNENYKLIENLKIEITELKKDNINFKTNLIIYNRNYESFPLPIWEKVKRGKSFVLQYINPAYVKDFGHFFDYDRYKYMGYTDYEIYPKKIADRFNKIDTKVAFTGIPNREYEFVYGIDSTKISLDVIKWRVIERNDTLIRGMSINKK